MIQNWGKLLFMHWPLKPEALRPHIPKELEIDTYDGMAWIGIVPFTMWGIRHPLLPPLPRVSAFHELNVRTYVKYKGAPAVWFFSLDATEPLAVWGARRFYHLPYHYARISLDQQGDTIFYKSQRAERGVPDASLEVCWRIGEALPLSREGTLSHFLTERYSLFSEYDRKIFRAQIHHPHWPLRNAEVISLRSTMIDALGIPEPIGAPMVHYNESLRVKIWPLKKA